jgi:hypothetical protein
MANNLACHAGDIVLLRAEIIGVGSDGPATTLGKPWRDSVI